MGSCFHCGQEHAVLDPAFRRPEAYVRLSQEARDEHAKADDDLCRINLPGEPARFFVRGCLPVNVRDRAEDLWWGLWAEISHAAFRRVLELWSAEDSSNEPPIAGTLANTIAGYPETVGLPLLIRLTGPTSRPNFQFVAGAEHPFVVECAAGVDSHRAAEWVDLVSG